MENFREYFWKQLTKSNCFKHYNIIFHMLGYIANKEVKKLYFICVNIFRLPISFYKTFKIFVSKEDFM